MISAFSIRGAVTASCKHIKGFPTGIGLITLMMVVQYAWTIVGTYGVANGALFDLFFGHDYDLVALEVAKARRIFFVSLLLLPLIVFLEYWLFNLWVRYAALGSKAAFPGDVGEGLIAALWNTLKGLAIMVLGLVVFLIVAIPVDMVMTYSGLWPLTDEGGAIWRGFFYDVGVFATITWLYAFFSDGFTRTALGRDYRPVKVPPLNGRFAAVLLLIGLIEILPLAVFKLFSFSDILRYGLVLPLGVISAAAFVCAHGLRYDWQLRAADRA